MDSWFPARVALDDYGCYQAQVNLRRWNSFLIPRFTKPVAHTLVEDLHGEFQRLAEKGYPPDGLDFAWQDETVVIRNHCYPSAETGLPYEVETVEPDSEGFYRIGGASMVWCAVQEPWPGREAVTATVLASRVVQEKEAAAWSLHLARRSGDRIVDHHLDDAVLALDVELVRLGVPVAELPGVESLLIETRHAKQR